MVRVHRLKAMVSSGLFCVLVFGGCAGHLPYDTLSGHLAAGNCDQALRLVEQSRGAYGTKSELLFLLDSAMVHMACQKFETAQEGFRKAEDLAQELWTRSLSQEVLSLIANDYLLVYPGEDYERAMIHLMSALAYLSVEKFEDALVECRRLDSLLALYNDRYDEKNVYKEDAFGRYLSGILNEADHDLDAAFIDYKKALEIYADYGSFYQTPAPSFLKEDFMRVAQRVNRKAEALAIVPDGEEAGKWLPHTPGLGEIVVIFLSGTAPVKTEDRIYIPTRQGPITLAFPRFLPTADTPKNIPVFIKSQLGQREVRAELVADISAIARKNLADHRARIIAKTIARAVAKQVVIQQAAKQAAKNKDKDVEQAIETALNLLNLFLEHADLRSWRTLPAAIFMARAFVEPGDWQVAVPSPGNGGEKTKNILVTAGKIHYIVVNDSFGL
ncbi:MAG: hypothetical protein KJ658_16555 [Proteobacteria bacterium]|nr:hypothetical protein [Pseudomonadota bacterium]